MIHHELPSEIWGTLKFSGSKNSQITVPIEPAEGQGFDQVGGWDHRWCIRYLGFHSHGGTPNVWL